ncbi:hypothetical protein [Bacillus inaquosorum]|uniref:hypothetical protein n=1 Tax=Bacillus inaquosorum TaxID=483913 RepID=UPI00227E666F|nr:hypothetical protein [Bacillus inaquosorum]MCY7764384.1 hypothetical protein [Bacillus inaquosorum]MCY9100207.1 hypothetical protein [Bacillus inaquosorum]
MRGSYLFLIDLEFFEYFLTFYPYNREYQNFFWEECKMILFIIIALCGYLLFSFSKDNRRKPQKTSPLPAAAPHHNNLIDLDAIRQKRRMHLS